jgi:hypothetical protein
LEGAGSWATEVSNNASARTKLRSDQKRARVTKVFK